MPGTRLPRVTGDGAERTPAARLAGAALALLQARRLGAPFDGFAPGSAPLTEAEGYLVQDGLVAALEGELGPRAGYKIGCTTPVMQAYLGIDHPCAGAVLARTIHAAPATVSCGGRRLGVECELAVRLARDLPSRPGREQAASAVGEVCAAIELVEDRYADFRALDLPALVADNFFAAGCVLGPPVAAGAAGNLAAVSAELSIGGTPAGAGTGAAILGHPLEALAWLAGFAASRGRPLAAGEVVLLGSLVETRWVAPGDQVVVRSDLGEVRLRLVE